MKAEYINPFIKASTEVLKKTTNTEFATGAPYLKTSPFAASNLVILIGITGEIRGQAVFTMDVEVAKNIASGMMMGMPVESIDEMAKSALSELTNMVMGNAATLLFNEGVTVDITPPSLMVGEKIEISSGDMQTIGVPLTSSLGEVTLDISVKDA